MVTWVELETNNRFCQLQCRIQTWDNGGGGGGGWGAVSRPSQSGLDIREGRAPGPLSWIRHWAQARVGACDHLTDYSSLCCGNTLPAQSFFRLLEFPVLEKDCLNRVKSLLSMRFMLLGYSFEPRPNSRALGTAGSVMTIALFNKQAHSKKPVYPRENKIDFSRPYSRRRQKGTLLAGCRRKGFSTNGRVCFAPVTHPVFLLTFTLRAK